MSNSGKTLIGWREWGSLPALGIPALKLKIDTGARTSALHAFKVEIFEEDGLRKARFAIHPLQRRKDIEIVSVAHVVDERVISDSGGHREKRLVIRTPLRVGNETREVEFTLTDRDTMRFRALLGRTGMEGFIVDPEKSYLTGKTIRHEYMKALKKERKV